jgi:hypothetical protein
VHAEITRDRRATDSRVPGRSRHDDVEITRVIMRTDLSISIQQQRPAAPVAMPAPVRVAQPEPAAPAELPPPPKFVATLGRNDACWCGSAKKYKLCHMAEDQASGRVATADADAKG